MGYGQYSAGGGLDRTKADMMWFAVKVTDGASVVWSRKAGKNRLHFKDENGKQYFILHETVIATLSGDGSTLTLADGGWHTMTTKAAWGDACGAFGFKSFYHHEAWSGGEDDSFRSPEYDSMHNASPTWPRRDQRSVTYRVTRIMRTLIERGERLDDGKGYGEGKPFDAECTTFEVADVAQSDPYLIRADVDYSNVEVRWDGKVLRSNAGIEGKATPFGLLCILRRIDALARATSGFVTFRGNALYQFAFEARIMGESFTIHPGQTARSMMVGCHTFKTQDFRALLKRIAADFPDADKLAKAFIKRNPNDFGVTKRGERRLVA